MNVHDDMLQDILKLIACIVPKKTLATKFAQWCFIFQDMNMMMEPRWNGTIDVQYKMENTESFHKNNMLGNEYDALW